MLTRYFTRHGKIEEKMRKQTPEGDEDDDKEERKEKMCELRERLFKCLRIQDLSHSNDAHEQGMKTCVKFSLSLCLLICC